MESQPDSKIRMTPSVSSELCPPTGGLSEGTKDSHGEYFVPSERKTTINYSQNPAVKQKTNLWKYMHIPILRQAQDTEKNGPIISGSF